MKTVVLGASPNPERVSNQVIYRLISAGVEPIPIGNREGVIAGKAILLGQPELEEIHTITLYLNATRQQPLYDYILGLQPQRIIFNPGTENVELAKLAQEQKIVVEVACTLVMLATGAY